MRVSVFGGASPKPGEPAYEEAFRLGQILAQKGHTVLTGGYIGTMEAVSRGASEAGGHVIGVTCEEIEKWRPVSPNQYIIEHMRFPTLSARLMALIFNGDAAIALPGGAGTLAEIAMMWNYMIINGISPRPLILVGTGWRRAFAAMLDDMGEYVTARDQGLLTFVENIDAAVQALEIASAVG